jgi:hypothetical protein
MTPTMDIDQALGILPQESRNAVLEKLKDFSEIPTVILDIQSLESSRQLHTVRPSDEAQLATSCQEITSPYIIKNRAGEILLIYLPDFLDPSLVREMASALRNFSSTERFSVPANDPRHGDMDVNEFERKYGLGKFGTIHAACWMEEGKRDRPLVCKEMIGACRVFDDYSKFIQEIGNVKAALGEAFAAVAPTKWRTCVDNCTKLTKYAPASFSLFQGQPSVPWSSLAVTANIQTHIHRDNNDAQQNLSGLCFSGKFKEAWLVIHGAGVKFRLDPRHILLMNTYVLPHFIRRSESKTSLFYSIAFFNHQNVMDWVVKTHQERKASKLEKSKLEKGS